MKKCFILAIAFSPFLSFAQKESTAKIRLAFPFIQNNSEIITYTLGNPKVESGKALSVGFNLSYNKILTGRFGGRIGLGYFNQNFKLNRPYSYDSPLGLMFYTNSYKYQCFQLLGGLYYQISLSKLTDVSIGAHYNHYFSFSQRYNVTYDNYPDQKNSKFFAIGNAVNIEAEILKKINEKIEIGLGVIYPVLVTWKNDEIFLKNNNDPDSKKLGKNKFSFGANVSFSYQL